MHGEGSAKKKEMSLAASWAVLGLARNIVEIGSENRDGIHRGSLEEMVK